MSTVKIRSGTRVKLKRINDQDLDHDFLNQLKEAAHQDAEVEAVFFFAMQRDEEEENLCLSIAMKKRIFGDGNEEFLRFVDEIQIILPEDLALNIYRFGLSEFLSSFCVHQVEPCHLRSRNWLEKRKKKYPKPS